MKTTKESPAMSFVSCLWNGALKATGHSWQRLNSGMYEAVSLAIGTGLEFAVGDVRAIHDGFRGGYWFGEQDGEGWYGHAIKVGNASAWKSIEEYRGRKPFIWDDVRLYVGSQFSWDGRTVTLTSFDDRAGTMLACTYKPQETDERGYAKGARKVEKRYRIDHDKLLQGRADAKRRVELMKQLTEISKDNGNSIDILARLKIKTKVEFDRLPVSKIEAVLAELTPAAQE